MKKHQLHAQSRTEFKNQETRRIDKLVPSYFTALFSPSRALVKRLHHVQEVILNRLIISVALVQVLGQRRAEHKTVDYRYYEGSCRFDSLLKLCCGCGSNQQRGRSTSWSSSLMNRWFIASVSSLEVHVTLLGKYLNRILSSIPFFSKKLHRDSVKYKSL